MNSPNPLTCCDRDCAAANHCVVGGFQCEDCGEWYCPSCGGGYDNVCELCAERRRVEVEEEEEDA